MADDITYRMLVIKLEISSYVIEYNALAKSKGLPQIVFKKPRKKKGENVKTACIANL
jgi:hypothetical protein